MSKVNHLKIAMEFLPEKLDSIRVGSFSEYYLLEHLTRSLVSFDKLGNIKGDIAKSWTITNSFKEYRFKLSDNAYFSDGTKIQVIDVISTFKRAKSNQSKSVHFNFSNVKSIVDLGSGELKIEFHEAQKNFLYDVMHPELRVLHSSDYKVKEASDLNYKVTSGPYFLINKSNKEYQFQYNSFYPGIESSPRKVSVKWPSYEEGFKSLVKKGDFDLIWNSTSFKEPSESELKSNTFCYYLPRLSFTFWLSLNDKGPNQLTKENKAWISFKVKESKEDVFSNKTRKVTLADQLYLPNGPGRPSVDDVKKINEILRNAKKTKPKKIKLLLSLNLLSKEKFIKLFESTGVLVDVDYYKTFSEYQDIIKKTSYDVVQVNNDFSYPNLRGSLNVTLNPDRPLVFADKSLNIEKKINKLNNDDIIESRNETVKEIGVELLKSNSVVPLFYHHALVYHQCKISLDNWSKVFPDLSTWKIRSSN